MSERPEQGWLPIVEKRMVELGTIVHVAAGCCVPGEGGALDLLGRPVIGSAIWAVGRGVPDEVVARLTYSGAGKETQAEAVLSWGMGIDAEVLVATCVAAREWLIITGTLGEIEIRPAPYATASGQVWVSDGTSTERVPFGRAEPVRLVDEGDAESVLQAMRDSAARGGQPQSPS